MSVEFDYKLFNLERRDVTVYETMLALDEAASIRAIADLTHLNRGTTFEVIRKLVRLGLVAVHFKSKRKYYVAQPPDSLRRHAEGMYEQMNQQLVPVNDFVQELKNRKSTVTNGQFTQFYENEEEIAILLRDVLDTTAKSEIKEYKVISSAEIRNHLYGKFRNFTKQRIKQGIRARVIAIGEGGDHADLAERRWLSSSRVPACYVIIYGDKVAQISLSERGIIQGVVVQNAGISQLQELMFDSLWKYIGSST